jgi:hypothetical protein
MELDEDQRDRIQMLYRRKKLQMSWKKWIQMMLQIS